MFTVRPCTKNIFPQIQYTLSELKAFVSAVCNCILNLIISMLKKRTYSVSYMTLTVF